MSSLNPPAGFFDSIKTYERGQSTIYKKGETVRWNGMDWISIDSITGEEIPSKARLEKTIQKVKIFKLKCSQNSLQEQK